MCQKSHLVQLPQACGCLKITAEITQSPTFHNLVLRKALLLEMVPPKIAVWKPKKTKNPMAIVGKDEAVAFTRFITEK